MTFSLIEVRRVLLLITVAMTSLALGACDDFLVRTPDDAVSSAEFFENEEHVNQGVLGIYAKLQDVYANQWRFTEQRSDNTTTQFNDANRGPHPTWFVEEFVMSPSSVVLEPFWQDVYEGIQRSNAVLNNVADVTFANSALKDQLTGEAKFLRALFYFNLVRLFGDVPLVLDQVQDPGSAFSTLEERTDTDRVYEQIISDANDAIDLLPPSYSGENLGRATKGAARALLAEVYLTRKDYADAEEQLRVILGMNYSLLPSYESVFDPANKNHQESIFAVQYAEIQTNLALGATFIYMFAPHNSGSEITGDNADNPDGLNIPTRDMLNAYEPGDVRKDVSIGFFVDPSNREHGIAIGDTIPYIKKYVSDHAVRGVTSDNWPIYRYSEVLLMLAEVLNEMGNTAEAYAYVDQVRQRAGLENLSSGLSQAELRDAVYHEQRVELAFEGDRWFQLLRTGRALEEMREHGEQHRNIQTHLAEPAYQIEEYKLKYPIPQRELSLNPNIEQNPGW